MLTHTPCVLTCCIHLPSVSCVQVSSRRRPNESDADWAKRQEAARQEVNSHLLVFIHGALQALTAIGLLQVRLWTVVLGSACDRCAGSALCIFGGIGLGGCYCVGRVYDAALDVLCTRIVSKRLVAAAARCT